MQTGAQTGAMKKQSALTSPCPKQVILFDFDKLIENN